MEDNGRLLASARATIKVDSSDIATLIRQTGRDDPRVARELVLKVLKKIEVVVEAVVGVEPGSGNITGCMQGHYKRQRPHSEKL